MASKASVFASKAERTNFEKLSRAWGKKYRLWHNIPFLNVYNTSDLLDPVTCNPLTVEPQDFQRLKKTSIDYVLCDSDDAPLVCIDFDGIGNGFSRGLEYVSAREDEWRKRIMNLKLTVAHGSDLCSYKAVPYFVVGNHEFKDLTSRVKLTIVDGIIGEALAYRAVGEIFSNGFEASMVGMTSEEFEDLTEAERSEQIQDWVFANELACEAKHSHLFKANGRMMQALREQGIFEYGCRIEYLSDPPVPLNVSQDERWSLMDSANRSGLRYRLYYYRIKQGETITLRGADSLAELPFIEKEVWLPNFQRFSTYNLRQEICRLLCQLELHSQYI